MNLKIEHQFAFDNQGKKVTTGSNDCNKKPISFDFTEKETSFYGDVSLGVNSDLWGNNKQPLITQGNRPDCFLISKLNDLASDPVSFEQLKKNVKKTDNNYEVTLYYTDPNDYQTKSRVIYFTEDELSKFQGGPSEETKAPKGFQAIEFAYFLNDLSEGPSKIKDKNKPLTPENLNMPNDYKDLAHEGQVGNAHFVLTGNRQNIMTLRSGSGPFATDAREKKGGLMQTEIDDVGNSPFSAINVDFEKNSYFASTIQKGDKKAIYNGKEINCAIEQIGDNVFPPGHLYRILKYDKDKKEVYLQDPHFPEKEIKINEEQFSNVFSKIDEFSKK